MLPALHNNSARSGFGLIARSLEDSDWTRYVFQAIYTEAIMNKSLLTTKLFVKYVDDTGYEIFAVVLSFIKTFHKGSNIQNDLSNVKRSHL